MTIRLKFVRNLGAAAASVLLFGASAFAQAGAPLGDSIQRAASAATAAASDDPQAAAAPDNPVVAFFKNTELSGFVDTYYSYNFNTPSKPCATIGGVAIYNCLHNFDVAHNSFSLNLAEVALEKKPTTDSRGGFRVDLDYGSAAAIVAGAEPGGTTTYENIQQAYLSYLAPAGGGSLQLDFGKFVTMHGYEVIETKDNWNYSRSLLFALAIPYYHMGARAAYSPNDKVTLSGYLVNGWNDVVDNNTGKTVGVSLALKPNANTSFITNYMGGPETAGDNNGWRHLSDTILSYGLSKAATLALNYDLGKDANTDQLWQGVAAYMKYQANDWFAVVPRYEYLKDRDAFMTGTAQNLQEFTLTTEFKHKDGVMMRVEYRGDFAGEPYFLKNASELVKNQNALTIGWVYAFSSKTP